MEITSNTYLSELFDIEDEAAIKMEEAKAAALKARENRLEQFKAKAEQGENKPVTAPKKDTFKVLADTIIRYAGLDIPVTDYFTLEEIENGLPGKKKKSQEVDEDLDSDDTEEESNYASITENDLRKKLEDDYPELVAGFTQLVYIEKKNIIVPVLAAKKKGMSDCMETSTNVEVSVSSKRKIPFTILADFIKIAKEFSYKYGTEVMADIYLDLDDKEFFMDIPKQSVSPVLCTRLETAFETAIKLIDRRYIKVMEIHSHHQMQALPSSIDDANERSTILYAIVGLIDNLFPEVTVRTFHKETQTHIPLNPVGIFDNSIFGESAHFYDTSVVEVG